MNELTCEHFTLRKLAKEEPIDSLDSILTDHRIAWLQMLNELNDEIISVPEMLEIKAKIITDTKQAIKDLFSRESRELLP